MEAVERMDELIKDYLLFRGFPNTLKTLEGELKNDKDKAYRGDKILEQILASIQNSDIMGLQNLWTHLERRVFSRLEYSHSTNVRKLQVSIFRYYVVTASANNRSEKVTEFFEKMSDQHSQQEWKDWFVLPFIKNAEQNPTFEVCFTRQWQETVIISLHNFLNVIFQSMPLPTLLNFDREQEKMKTLRDENNRLHSELASIEKVEAAEAEHSTFHFPLATTEIPDDFAKLTDNQRDFGSRLPKSKPANKKSPSVARKQTSSSGEKSPKMPHGPEKNVHKNIGGAQQIKVGSLPARAVNTIFGQKKDIDKRKSESSALGVTSMSSVQQLNQPKPKTAVNLDQQRKLLFQKSKETTSQRNSSKPATVRSTSDDVSVADTEMVASDRGQQALVSSIGGSRELAGGVDSKGVPFLVLSQDEYTEHHSSITQCKFSPTANSVATMDIDGVVKIWNFSPMPNTIATIMFKSPLISMEWNPKMSRYLLLGSSDGLLKLYDVDAKRSQTEVEVDPSCPRIISLACNPTNNTFVTSITSQESNSPSNTEIRLSKLLVWDVKKMKLQKEFAQSSDASSFNCMSFNHNGNLMVAGTSDGSIRLYDMHNYECLLEWSAHAGALHAAKFSPDENSVFTMGADGKFIKWAMHRPGEQINNFAIHEGATGPFVMSGYGGYKQQQSPQGKLFAFDSSGRYILTCAHYGGIIYEIQETGTLQQTLTILGHRTPVVSVDWCTSVNTGMCLTGSMDGKVQVTTLLSQ